ncbi:MAG: TetR/AcrR family transcriptional regulator [Alphaproteobacteria bacterium]|nr:TetR/AcrR family transcriptional regulator [Alphaproteobacteria bacterium]
MTRHDDPQARRGYHHGNLREALIEAARQLMAEHGPEGVTLSEAARMAGVSPAAPYRHFKDRANLVAALALQGFAAFADGLDKAWNNGAGGPLAALTRIGYAYIDFVRRQPAFYTAMFESGIDHGSDPDLSRESNRAFGVLRDAAAAMHAILPEDRRAPPLMIALHVWTMAHGIASLFLRGDTARRNLPVTPEDLLESGILIYLDGLGLHHQR